VTVKLTLVECCSVPLVPVIARLYVPGEVLEPVDTVKVELPDVLIDGGLKLHVLFGGQPVRLRLTVPLKPFCAVTVAV
jgi:hypothetical protein